MAQQTIIIKGDKEIQIALNNVGNKIKNASKLLKVIGDELVKYFVENMKSEGTKLLKKRWKALSPVTILDKSSKGFGGKRILERTGKLRRGIKVLRLTKKEVMIGNNVDYYAKHQLGTDANPKIPQRQIMGVNKDVEEIVEKVFDKFIKF